MLKSLPWPTALITRTLKLEPVRLLFDFMALNNHDKPFVRSSYDDQVRIETCLNSLIPDSSAKPYDMKELIVALAYESDFFEI